jgi:hypothetical protein
VRSSKLSKKLNYNLLRNFSDVTSLFLFHWIIINLVIHVYLPYISYCMLSAKLWGFHRRHMFLSTVPHEKIKKLSSSCQILFCDRVYQCPLRCPYNLLYYSRLAFILSLIFALVLYSN